jgi:uncharacterized protein YdbL (DUF1318 family)
MSRLILCFALLFSAAMIQASPLDDARTSGQIVELPTGYVKAIEASPAAIKALAIDVNARRAEAYGRIAKKNGLSEAQVAAESYKQRLGE